MSSPKYRQCEWDNVKFIPVPGARGRMARFCSDACRRRWLEYSRPRVVDTVRPSEPLDELHVGVSLYAIERAEEDRINYHGDPLFEAYLPDIDDMTEWHLEWYGRSVEQKQYALTTKAARAQAASHERPREDPRALVEPRDPERFSPR